MTACATLPLRFTQTDPLPYGAGTAFEESYAYGALNPLVNTDPGGMRFSANGVGVELIENSFASFGDSSSGHSPPPTTRVRIVGNQRCVTRERTSEERRKNPFLGPTVTECKKIPKTPVTTTASPVGTETYLFASFDAKRWG